MFSLEVRLTRVNKNGKVLGHETKTMSHKELKGSLEFRETTEFGENSLATRITRIDSSHYTFESTGFYKNIK